VEELLTNLLSNTQGIFAYGTIFLVLVVCGLGVPLPEDISLILGGFLAHKGAASLPIMMAVAFVGILAGDSLIFNFGRKLGSNVGRKPGGFFARIITPEKRAKVEGLFEKHGQKIVMIARFMPGVRAVTYFTAGSVGMPYWRFIVWDGMAALVSAPLFVFLGFHFGNELDFLINKIKEGQAYVLTGMAVIAVGWFLWRRRRTAALRTQMEQGGALASVMPVLSQESSSRPAPFLDAAEKKAVAGRTRTSELQK
jgi:membrane protein DedA with SNARE-associated domain